MVKFTLAASVSALLLASATIAAPTAPRTVTPRTTASIPPGCTSVNTKDDLVCDALLTPLNAFLNYQSANIGTSVVNILEDVNKILEAGGQGTPLTDIVSTATGGLVGSLLNGVTSIIYGLGAAVQDVDPQCACDLGYCNNLLISAEKASAAQQSTAQDACLQSKYACAPFYSTSQIDSMIPYCSQFTTSG